MKYLLLILTFIGCSNPLKRITQNYHSDMISFEYIDKNHIKVTATIAVWLAAGYHGDTILLNPLDFILLKVPDDEFNVSIGNGIREQEFIF